ncbi:FadR/GntR family transcriptional regulator [Tabrizicola sp.]|jgi:GntR family transcriptional repressor for pyruvate dehydrogenase complex|uniref:FadR/GntR family transcriptional regulator n=1 Tax=Tabrizicola sp. TaxID=2005166 RepID=UPI001A5CBF46|nr:FadR/GntR family transcriptional regulator [Tabrizicola sp.]MBL9063729.1 FadR family transcriptional regulator [Tabrizicola sp.]
MKRKSLSTVVFEGLLDQIRSGRLGPGAQLPTEADLCDSFAVSRTVVREAVARLRSEGLVIPRQGKGVFVSEAPLGSFSIPDQDLDALPQTLALLELRLGVEVESAGLCALRCTRDEAQAIRAEMERVDATHPDPTSTRVHYDHEFHLLIARGSHNPQIIDFLSYLGQQIGPRLRLGYILLPALKDEYFDRIHGEHRAVVEAIEQRNPDLAREAMRNHLSNSLERLRALAKVAGTRPLPGAA